MRESSKLTPNLGIDAPRASKPTIEILPPSRRLMFRRARKNHIEHAEDQIRLGDELTEAKCYVSAQNQFKSALNLLKRNQGFLNTEINIGQSTIAHYQKELRELTKLRRQYILYPSVVKITFDEEICLREILDRHSRELQTAQERLQTNRELQKSIQRKINTPSLLQMATVRLYFSLGIKAYRSLDYMEARRLFSPITRNSPYHIQSYIWNAKTLIKIWNYRKELWKERSVRTNLMINRAPLYLQRAIICSNQVLLLENNNAEAFYIRACTLDSQGNTEAALDDYVRTIAHGGENSTLQAKAYLRMGYLYLRQTHYNQAMESFSEAASLRTSKRAQAYLMLGALQLFLRTSRKQVESALDNLNAALRFNSNLIIAYGYRAEAKIRLGQQYLQSAQQDIIRMQSQCEKHALDEKRYDQQYESIGLKIKFKMSTREILSRDKARRSLILKKYMVRRDFLRLSARLNVIDLIQKRPETNSQTQPKQASETSSDNSEAINLFEQYPTKTNALEKPITLYETACHDMETGYYDTAIEKLDEAIELVPKIPRFYYARARAYQRRAEWGDDKLALADFEMAAQLAPGQQKYQEAAKAAFNIKFIPIETIKVADGVALEVHPLAPLAKNCADIQLQFSELEIQSETQIPHTAEQRAALLERIEAAETELSSKAQESNDSNHSAALSQLKQQMAEMRRALDVVEEDVTVISKLIQRERVRQSIKAYVSDCAAAHQTHGVYYHQLRNKLVALFKAIQLAGESEILQRSKYSTHDKATEILEKVVHGVVAATGFSIASAALTEAKPIISDTLEAIRDTLELTAEAHAATEIGEHLRSHHAPHTEDAALERGAHRLFLFGFQATDLEVLAEQLAFLMLVRNRNPMEKLNFSIKDAGKLAEFTAARVFSILKAKAFKARTASDVVENILLYMRYDVLAESKLSRRAFIRKGLRAQDILGRTGIQYKDKQGNLLQWDRDATRKNRTNASEFGYCIGSEAEARFYRYAPRKTRPEALSVSQASLAAQRELQMLKEEARRTRLQIERLQRTVEVCVDEGRPSSSANRTSSFENGDLSRLPVTASSQESLPAAEQSPSQISDSSASQGDTTASTRVSVRARMTLFNRTVQRAKCYTLDDINTNYWYTDREINTNIEAWIKHEIGGYASKNHRFLLNLSKPSHPSEPPRFVAVTPPAIADSHTIQLDSEYEDVMPFTWFLDKSQQHKSEMRDDRCDVFDELCPAMHTHDAATADILFLYNTKRTHYCLMQINISKTTQNGQAHYQISVHLMDPLAQHKLDDRQRHELSTAIRKGLATERVFNGNIEFKENNHPRQQARDDSSACGPISLAMLKRKVLQQAFNTKPYPMGARALRFTQLSTIIQHHQPHDATCVNCTRAIIGDVPSFEETADEKRIADAAAIKRIALTRAGILAKLAPSPVPSSGDEALSDEYDGEDETADGARTSPKTPLLKGL